MSVQNVELNEEYLKEIEQFSAIDIENEKEYVPVAFRKLPEDKQPKFTIRALDGVDYVTALKEKNEGEYCLNICKRGIVKWETYYTLKGKIIEFNADLRGLNSTLINELAEEIILLNSIKKGEELGLK